MSGVQRSWIPRRSARATIRAEPLLGQRWVVARPEATGRAVTAATHVPQAMAAGPNALERKGPSARSSRDAPRSRFFGAGKNSARSVIAMVPPGTAHRALPSVPVPDGGVQHLLTAHSLCWSVDHEGDRRPSSRKEPNPTACVREAANGGGGAGPAPAPPLRGCRRGAPLHTCRRPALPDRTRTQQGHPTPRGGARPPPVYPQHPTG